MLRGWNADENDESAMQQPWQDAMVYERMTRGHPGVRLLAVHPRPPLLCSTSTLSMEYGAPHL